MKAHSPQVAAKYLQRANLAKSQIQQNHDIHWSDKKLLEVGCGQNLGYTSVFAAGNDVTAIDSEPPLETLSLKAIAGLFQSAGIYRGARSLINLCLGKHKYFKQALMEQMGVKSMRRMNIRKMNACHLDFPDNSFDGAFSFSVFEHIDDPQRALDEVHRILKPGGLFYLDIHLFTAIHGDHDFRPQTPPWNHLRFQSSCPHYVNEIRLKTWNEMLNKTFGEVRTLNIDGEITRGKQYLSESIREELQEFSEEELLTTTYIAICKKY
ncbi:MAG: class I SAM-dependent methyltransferase [Planctomycetes bacterium]|nr:class I SAM-dependent methyltransferase [Planctomycetota bacterium]